MGTLVSNLTDVQAALDTLARQHKVPGASLGVLNGDELVEFATGVANRNTGVAVTPRTLFQIGSNTKLYTATLVMQLVDEGLVDLDAPVKEYIPELELGDRGALGAVTPRMLLTHTSGIEGDHFEDFGRGDDGIAAFVRSLKGIGQVHAPGEMWSYCNSGFVLAGRLVEKVRGESYHQALRSRILEPIGARATTVLMEEMLAHSCAVGHVLLPGQSDPIVPPTVMMSFSQAPAGSMTTSTPQEVLRFVRLHLEGGRSRTGVRVLAPGIVRQMQEPQAKLPRSSLGSAMGLGWLLSDWDGERVIGHGGGTIGQLSFLQVLPDRPFAVCLLTNCSTGGALWRDLGRYLFEEFAGVSVPQLPKAPDDPPKLDLSKYAGTYRRLGIDAKLEVEDGRLTAEIKGTGAMAELAPPRRATATPVDKEVFVVNIAGEDTVAQFLDFDRSGRPRLLHVGGRVAKRVEDGAPSASKRPKAKASSKRPKAKASSKRSKSKASSKRRPVAKAKRPARKAKARSRRR